jgi:hypothetical protein
MNARSITLAIATAVAGALVMWSPTAWAGSSGTGSVSCGSSGLTWDAPNGYVVMTRGDGPVKAVIDAVGESRTHSMLSHGTINWSTHSTMYEPGQTGWPTYCSTPVEPSDIAQGYPGLAQINNSGLYQYNYEHGAPEYMRKQSGSTGGVTTANWAWSSSNYQWVASSQGSGGIYLVRTESGNDRQPYSFYQYYDNEGRSQGSDNVRYHGGHCSSMIAWMASTSGWDDITPHTYNNTLVTAAGSALYTSVKNECDDGLGFWKGIGAAITCFEGICDDAGRQIRACFLGDVNCDTDSNSLWNGIKNNSAKTAVSLSPDDLTGWSGHEWGANKPHTGPWSPYGYSNTTWSAGGSTYGCWF